MTELLSTILSVPHIQDAIFSYSDLPVRDLASASRVCKRWHEMLAPYLWATVRLDGKKVDDQDFQRFLISVGHWIHAIDTLWNHVHWMLAGNQKSAVGGSGADDCNDDVVGALSSAVATTFSFSPLCFSRLKSLTLRTACHAKDIEMESSMQLICQNAKTLTSLRWIVFRSYPYQGNNPNIFDVLLRTLTSTNHPVPIRLTTVVIENTYLSGGMLGTLLKACGEKLEVFKVQGCIVAEDALDGLDPIREFLVVAGGDDDESDDGYYDIAVGTDGGRGDGGGRNSHSLPLLKHLRVFEWTSNGTESYMDGHPWTANTCWLAILSLAAATWSNANNNNSSSRGGNLEQLNLSGDWLLPTELIQFATLKTYLQSVYSFQIHEIIHNDQDESLSEILATGVGPLKEFMFGSSQMSVMSRAATTTSLKSIQLLCGRHGPTLETVYLSMGLKSADIQLILSCCSKLKTFVNGSGRSMLETDDLKDSVGNNNNSTYLKKGPTGWACLDLEHLDLSIILGGSSQTPWLAQREHRLSQSVVDQVVEYVQGVGRVLRTLSSLKRLRIVNLEIKCAPAMSLRRDLSVSYRSPYSESILNLWKSMVQDWKTHLEALNELEELRVEWEVLPGWVRNQLREWSLEKWPNKVTIN